jgi:F420-dependent methylenetetrahydromethanopterin dehydrogenase
MFCYAKYFACFIPNYAWAICNININKCVFANDVERYIGLIADTNKDMANFCALVALTN